MSTCDDLLQMLASLVPAAPPHADMMWMWQGGERWIEVPEVVDDWRDAPSTRVRVHGPPDLDAADALRKALINDLAACAVHAIGAGKLTKSKASTPPGSQG